MNRQRFRKEMYYKATDPSKVQLLHKAIDSMAQIACPDH